MKKLFYFFQYVFNYIERKRITKWENSFYLGTNFSIGEDEFQNESLYPQNNEYLEVNCKLRLIHVH